MPVGKRIYLNSNLDEYRWFNVSRSWRDDGMNINFDDDDNRYDGWDTDVEYVMTDHGLERTNSNLRSDSEQPEKPLRRVSMAPVRRALPLLLLAAVAAGAVMPAVVRADYEETERRLKAVGVDDDLRAGVHRAIDRAVAWFAVRQISDGSWLDPGTWAGGWGTRTALTTISALAVRHAGTPAAREVAGKAVRFLFERREARDEAVNFVYTAGLASMLLLADASYPKVHGVIATGLATAQDARTGWFGYVGHAEGYASPSVRDLVQLSTTQFAALGLWAAARHGIETPRDVWVRHARGLIAAQTKDGSWAYVPNPKLAGYSTGTFMGLANLLLCERQLGDLSADPDLAKHLLAAKMLALAALRRDVPRILASVQEGQGAWSYEGERWSYYGLYALEKACIFAGIERIGDRGWYEEGARGLLALQEKDGGWGIGSYRSVGTRYPARSDVLSTAFALLFLLRASEVYRPETPSPVDVPKTRVVTGAGSGSPSPESPAPSPLPNAPPK